VHVRESFRTRPFNGVRIPLMQGHAWKGGRAGASVRFSRGDGPESFRGKPHAG